MASSVTQGSVIDAIKAGIAGAYDATRAALNARLRVYAEAAVLYRSAITSADVLAAVGTVTCTKLSGVGSAAAGTYTVYVVAVTEHGSGTAKAGNTTVTTETTNLGVRAAFAAVTSADAYDIFMSTDGAAAKWVGRVTEAQRASGIIINGQNTTTAGGTAGGVDIYVAGTGPAVNGGQFVQSTAYVIPGVTAINCSGDQYVDVDAALSLTGAGADPALTLIPFWQDDLDSAWYGAEPLSLTFGGYANVYNSLQQTVRLEVRGRTAVHVLVGNIAGTGASLDLRVKLS